MQYDGQWFRDRRHGNGTLTIEAAGKAMGRRGLQEIQAEQRQALTTPVGSMFFKDKQSKVNMKIPMENEHINDMINHDSHICDETCNPFEHWRSRA